MEKETRERSYRVDMSNMEFDFITPEAAQEQNRKKPGAEEYAEHQSKNDGARDTSEANAAQEKQPDDDLGAKGTDTQEKPPQGEKDKLAPMLIAAFIALTIFLLRTSEPQTNDSIDGRDLRLAGEALVELAQSEVILTQTKKYTRHFKNGLYYEDLSEAQRELNELYNEHMRQEIDQYIKENLPILKNVPYILQNEIEYVNRDAKDYAEGKTKAEDIIDNPNSIMSIKLRWYLFEDFTQEGEISKASFEIQDYVDKYLVEKYIMQGVESFDFRSIAYHPATLDKYSLEEIGQKDNIYEFLKEEQQTLEFVLYKTYFSDEYIQDGKYLTDAGWGPRAPEQVNILKEQYGLDFGVELGFWYYPEKYPQVKFNSYVGEDGVWGHFQSAMYQYLANERVRRVIEEAGLSDKVVFLVTTEALGLESKRVKSAAYNFGEGFDEDFFLKKGYEGRVCVTLIYLDSEMPEDLDDDALDEHIKNIERELYTKVLFLLEQQLQFGIGEYVDEQGTEHRGGYKDAYLKIYQVSDYDREVIVDLFRKYPLTEREQKPNLGLADIGSPLFKARAETQGFHYLDIFGRSPLLDMYVDGLSVTFLMEKGIREGWYQPGN